MKFRCEHLEVRIGDVLVAEDLNLQLRPGQFWGLLGRNGAGKTTLLLSLAGLRPPNHGRLIFNEKPLPQWPRRKLACHLSMLQQHTAYLFDATVQQTALIGRHPYIGPWQREGARDRQITADALERLGLASLATRSVTTLSGGEARRLALATLLVQDAELMLLDEPTNHLDLSHQVQIMQLIRRLITDGGKSAFAALHDINLAARYCSHILMLLGNGQWLAGTAEEVIDEANLSRLYAHEIRRVRHPDSGDYWVASDSAAS